MLMTQTEIAKLCHEVNRSYCAAIGDDSQPSWEDAPEWQKASALKGVEMHMQNELSPRESHEAWFKHKLAEGWKYGPVKDADKREHPCCVEYHMLPAEQRAKDYIFSTIVKTVREISGERMGDGVVGDRDVVGRDD